MNIDYLLIPKCSKWHSKNFIKSMSYPNGTDLLYTISMCSCSIFINWPLTLKDLQKAPLVIPVMLAYLIIVSEISLYMYSLHTFCQSYKNSDRKSLHSNHDKGNIHNFILSTVEQNTNFSLCTHKSRTRASCTSTQKCQSQRTGHSYHTGGIGIPHESSIVTGRDGDYVSWV